MILFAEGLTDFGEVLLLFYGVSGSCFGIAVWKWDEMIDYFQYLC